MDEESCQERMADLAGRPPLSVLTEADAQMGMRDHVLMVGGGVLVESTAIGLCSSKGSDRIPGSKPRQQMPMLKSKVKPYDKVETSSDLINS
ncbi:hypothetical protein CCUS01_10100 [Colletotrichum cuscutae]|uniref:Uncharacterized protein n=1 Tax=Colletotrichum cuscutae TaxID=1209917 RepID=A0AAI9XQC2_9PEZI|nr:hypothetical protein CCUS01_10100 [Colletotrichum cuscutae]